MELTDLKTEIHRLVDELPENRLAEVRDLLEQKRQTSPLNPQREKLLNDIINENRELLQRLAQ